MRREGGREESRGGGRGRERMGWGEQIGGEGGGGAGKGESEMLKWNSNCGRCLTVAV